MVMLDRFRDLVVLIHDVVKELQAKAMAAEGEGEVEVAAGRGGPAAKIVSEIKKLFKLINVTGDDEVDDDGTLQPNARLALAEGSASSTSSEILSPFRAAVGATRLAQRMGGPGSGSGSGPGLATPTAAGRGTLRSLAASNAAGMVKAGRGTVSSLYAFSPRGKEQKKSTQRMRSMLHKARTLASGLPTQSATHACEPCLGQSARSWQESYAVCSTSTRSAWPPTCTRSWRSRRCSSRSTAR